MKPTPGAETAVSHPVLRGCLASFRRCETIVEHVRQAGGETADLAYRAIGPHLRHCLDHLRCLLGGLESGTVDYDARERNVEQETDAVAFLTVLRRTVGKLADLPEARLGDVVRVRQAADDRGEPYTTASNLARELVFLSSHTIHHLAIMVVLVRARGIDAPEDLAVAYSTAAWRRSREGRTT